MKLRGVVAVVLALPPAAMCTSVAAWAAGVRWSALQDGWHRACAQAPLRAIDLGDLGAMPLCARCTGLWIGAMAGTVIGATTTCIAETHVPRAWWWTFVGALLGFADGLGSVLGLWDAPAAQRVVSGAVLGLAGGYLASAVVQTVAFHAVAPERGRGEG